MFMSQKKRANKEIEEFLAQFSQKISHRLSLIQIIKLSDDHIEETRKEIEKIKLSLKETQAKIKIQKKVVDNLLKTTKAKKSSQLMVTSTKTPKIIDGVEVFTISEEDEEVEEQTENEDL